MRIALLAIGSLILLTMPASAQGRGTWCAQGGTQGDVVICRYFSFAQCQYDLSGRGGICIRNPAMQAYGYDGYNDGYHRGHKRIRYHR